MLLTSKLRHRAATLLLRGSEQRAPATGVCLGRLLVFPPQAVFLSLAVFRAGDRSRGQLLEPEAARRPCDDCLKWRQILRGRGLGANALAQARHRTS